MALTTTEARNLIGSTLNDWLIALAQGTNMEDFLTWNTNAQRLLNLLTTEPAPVLVRQEFNEDNVEVNINDTGLAEAFMDSLSSFFDGPGFARFLDTLRNQVTVSYNNPDEAGLTEVNTTPIPDSPFDIAVDVDSYDEDDVDTSETEDVEFLVSETVTESTAQPAQRPVQVSELLDDDDEDEAVLDEIDDSTFEPHPDIDRNTRSRWTTVGSGDQMSGYVFAAYSHLPYHFTRGGHQYKLTLSGSDFVATRV